jgi:hypothetical protein
MVRGHTEKIFIRGIKGDGGRRNCNWKKKSGVITLA